MALTDRHIVGISSETTYGTDAFSGSDPSSWLGIIGEPSIQETVVDVGPEEKTHDGMGGSILRYGEKTDVSFTAYLVGKDSAAGDPPSEIDTLLKASNLSETVNAGVDVTYDYTWGRDMSTVPAMTVFEGIRDDVSGNYYKRVVKGVRGVTSLVLEDGQDARLNFEGSGLYSEMGTTAASITAPTSYSGGKPRVKVQGMSLDYGGSTYPITGAEITTGMEVDEDRNLTASHAVDEVGLFLPNGNKPGGSITFKGRSTVISNILSKIQPDNGAFVEAPTADLVITLTSGSDTIKVTGTDCALGAYSKNLAGSNYLFDVPITILGNLSIEFT